MKNGFVCSTEMEMGAASPFWNCYKSSKKDKKAKLKRQNRSS